MVHKKAPPEPLEGSQGSKTRQMNPFARQNVHKGVFPLEVWQEPAPEPLKE